MRDRSQLVLPMELGVKIAENDPVRKLVEICEELDYTELYKRYVRRWRKVSPETLFELVVFGYMQRRFSTRQIEEACNTDIRFMWILQGEPVPDHSTIDRFLDKRLADVIEDLKQTNELANYFSYDNLGIKVYAYSLAELEGLHQFEEGVPYHGMTMRECADCSYCVINP